MRPQRPAAVTSWVQMSAAGATPLAPQRRGPGSSSSSSSQEQPAGPLAVEQPNARLSFISSGGGSSSSSCSSGASHAFGQFSGGGGGALNSATASSRLTSVLSGNGGGGGGGAQSGQSGQSLSSQLSHSSGPSSLSSSSSAAGGQSRPPPELQARGQLQMVSPMQQMQAAISELQLSEQQLLLKYSAGAASECALLGHSGGAGAPLAPDDLRQEQEREADRKLRLQLYVFVLRCISYPFNAKQTVTGDHRQQMVKLRKGQLEPIKQAHGRFLRASQSFAAGKCAHSHLSRQLTGGQLKQLDELYERAHETFSRRFLESERLRLLVEAECCSQQDLRDLFRQNAQRILKESQLFQSAHEQQQQHQHQQQQQQQRQQMRHRMSNSQTAASHRSDLSQQQLDEGSAGGDPQQQQPASLLLASREAILNSWQIKFESIIREDPGGNQWELGASSSPSGANSCAASELAGPPLGSASSGSQQNATLRAPLTKEQLYQMFQLVLSVKKFEHQLLYNALQLDSADEQAAAIRRELDGRVARIAELERNKKLLPKFVLKEMESLFLEETRMAANKLMVNLDSLPLVKAGGPAGGLIGAGQLGASGPAGQSAGASSSTAGSAVYSGLQKFRRYNSSAQLRHQTRAIEAAQRMKKGAARQQQQQRHQLKATKLQVTKQSDCLDLDDATTEHFGFECDENGSKICRAPPPPPPQIFLEPEAARLAAAPPLVLAAAKLNARQTDRRKRELRHKRPVSSFILKRAHEPLWQATFNSLSSFGKIAAQASLTRDGLAEGHPSEPALTKLDVVLTFNIEVIVMEVRGLRNITPTREIYCTMEIEGSETGRLQTEHVQARKPLWDTQGDFVSNHPLPQLKIKLYAVNPSMLSLEDKELGKLVLRPTVLSPKTPEWCSMVAATGSDRSACGPLRTPDDLLADNGGGGGGGGGPAGCSSPSLATATNNNSSSSNDNNNNNNNNNNSNNNNASNYNDNQLKIRVIVRMDRPQQLKHCGFLWGRGKSGWLKFKRRYHILIQVSQYTFVMCDFRDKKSKPGEMLQLDGYTVDYIEPPTDLITDHCSEITSAEHGHHHGHHHGHSSHHASSTFGLAGRLAKPFLNRQQNHPAGGGGGGNCADDATSGLASNSGEQGEQPSAIQTAAALSDELHNKFYFSIVKEGDSVIFGCDDEQECFGWVMALYRATGQAHKPTPLRDQYSSSGSHYLDGAFAYQTSVASTLNGAGGLGPGLGGGCAGGALSGAASLSAASSSLKKSNVVDVADQRARKHGMDEFIGADPWKFQHNQLFKYLQHETLLSRLNDQFCSLGWFSSGQLFVLDEYCARYGVRTCYRHLAYLNSLLDFNLKGYFIDHTLLNYGYDFCASFVSGQSGVLNPMSSVNFDLRPDGTVGTVTVEERDLFHCVKTKLLKMIERQIANFSLCFPYGKPDGSLKAALSLLERVLMKQETVMNQMNSMVQNEEVRSLIRKCLEQAALNDYTKLSGQANLFVAAPTVPLPAAPSQTGAPSSSSQTDQEAQTRSGQSTPSAGGSPVPPGPNFGDSLPALESRRRAHSSLSNSSSTSTSACSGPQSLSSLNDSIRRHNNQQRRAPSGAQAEQQQQQQQQCVTMAMVINNDQVRPQEKLVYLIRLAELCCEQVEENNEYFSDAFAWHSDLMIDHFELFWSLFGVDMDKVLAELGGSSAALATAGQNQQHPVVRTGSSASSGGGGGGGNSSDLLGVNNRDIFALFQVLNNHLRKRPNLECRKFKAYLCDTFKPKLLRYIDIMESTLTRMVFKACERDGLVNCQLVEQMFLRLDDLQRFVLTQLRWPDEQLAEQLHQRLKLISYELCDASVQRTLQAFQQLERKSNKWTATTTSYNSPVEMIQMINLTLDARNRSMKLCTFDGFDQMSYNSKIDKLVEAALGEMQPGLMAKMLNALDSTLNKLARFDEGNLLAPILSLTYKQGMSSSGKDIGKQYVSFVSNCCDLIRHKINDEIWIVTLLEDWYAAQMNTICNWLAERLDHSLHDVQLVALTNIMPKVYADMSLQGVSEDKLSLKTYQTIISRLKMEEAASLASGQLFEQQQPSTSIFKGFWNNQ